VNTRVFSVAAAVILGISPAVGWAQSISPYFVPSGGHIHGYGFGHSFGHASTFEEGVLNGYSNYLQGRGLYERYHADALIGFQQARALALQNDQAALKARLEALALRERRVAEEIRELAERNELAQLQRPLTNIPQAVVRPDGELIWPAELQGKDFAAIRAAIDAEFAELAGGNSGSVVTIKNQLDRLVSLASAKVRSQELSGSHLTAAIAFRDKAATAARQWTIETNATQAMVVSAGY
jgi:hypothetical protein